MAEAPGRMRLAVIGSGVSGLVAAWMLRDDHDITVLEAEDRIGGHTCTVEVDGLAIDMGFIVHNDVTYPNFIEIIRRLGVRTRPSNMSFAVRDEGRDFEWGSRGWGGLIAQKENLLRPEFYRMLADMLRFNREAHALAAAARRGELGAERTLTEMLDAGGYSAAFRELYLVPMGASVWSTAASRMGDFPALTFARFFDNHGFLKLFGRPTWRVVEGGSRRYVEALTASFAGQIEAGAAVEALRRDADGVALRVRGEWRRYDGVILATHSDDALRILGDDATPLEREVLGAIPYEDNEVVLHTDTRLLPRRRRAWSSWNYHILADRSAPVAVTYNMNLLQGLEADETYCVTLNRSADIDPARVLVRKRMAHPQFTPAAIAAQARHAEISGQNRTWFCGAYWRYGFHEDGVVSALAVAAQLGRRL